MTSMYSTLQQDFGWFLLAKCRLKTVRNMADDFRLFSEGQIMNLEWEKDKDFSDIRS